MKENELNKKEGDIMANKIPTAEVVLTYLIPNAKNLMTARQYENAINAIKAHSTYYVEAALKAASKAELDDASLMPEANDFEESRELSILNAYPLDLIK